MERRFRFSKKDKDVLVANISSRLQEREDVDFAYLFGSFAAAGTFGDIDIGVVFVGQADTLKEIALEQALETAVDYPVEVVDLRLAPLSFQFRAISTGRLLTRKDDNRRCDFEEKVMVRYAEMRPIHKYWHQEVLLGSR